MVRVFTNRFQNFNGHVFFHKNDDIKGVEFGKRTAQMRGNKQRPFVVEVTSGAGCLFVKIIMSYQMLRFKEYFAGPNLAVFLRSN